MRRSIAPALAVLAMSAMASAAVLPGQVKPGEIAVTATFKGKGTVDEKHDILVFLFDHPSPTADSRPIDVRSVTKNGQTVTFEKVTVDPVYVVMVYDEKAAYDGRSAPPLGAPIGNYGKAGKPIPVKPGSKVTATFDDTIRWK